MTRGITVCSVWKVVLTGIRDELHNRLESVITRGAPQNPNLNLSVCVGASPGKQKAVVGNPTTVLIWVEVNVKKTGESAGES